MKGPRQRPRLGDRLFDPEEVATVLDLFAPVQLALEHAGSPEGHQRLWPWREWKVPALVAAAILTVGVTGAALQASAVVVPVRAEPARPPRAATYITQLPSTPRLAIAPPPAPPRSVPPPRVRPPGEVETLAALNRRALSEYERSRSEQALRLLSQALRLCQRPALAWHALCATTHVNLGRVLAGGYRQSGLAARHFRIADAIRPSSASRAPGGGRTLQRGLTSEDRSSRGGL
jgi:hypothetical protein